ncbi:MAG: hypothetical protein J7497_02445 [Chitinophagaceae bacterium]|nr:hypothetical protein [Chitinophagaceae bacterium]
MKTRLNLTIEDSLLDSVKAYAARKNISVSELVEKYFRNLNKPANKKNIITLIEQLPRPKIDVSGNLKKQYYEDQAGRYGF